MKEKYLKEAIKAVLLGEGALPREFDYSPNLKVRRETDFYDYEDFRNAANDIINFAQNYSGGVKIDDQRILVPNNKAGNAVKKYRGKRSFDIVMNLARDYIDEKIGGDLAICFFPKNENKVLVVIELYEGAGITAWSYCGNKSLSDLYAAAQREKFIELC